MLYTQYTVKITSLAIFGLALLYYVLLRSPDHTFFNMGEDGPLFVQTAKYLVTGGASPGSPLYHLTNAGWIRIFSFGTEYGSIAILSAVYSAITAGLLYLITRSVLAPLLWISSAIVLSQSTILELYTLTALIMLLGYYAYTKDKRVLAYFIFGLGLAVHHTSGLGFVALVINDFINKRSLKPALAFFLCIPLFLYVPLTNRPPYYMIGGESLSDYTDYFFKAASGVAGGLPLWPLSNIYERLWDVSRVLLGGLGISLVLSYLAARSNWREHLPLILLGLLPLVYYVTSSDSKAYFSILPTIAFLAILATKYDWKSLKITCSIICSCLIVMNIFLYDFGRVIDKEQTAVQFYNQLQELPPGSALETCWCADQYNYINMTYLHNLENDDDIYIINTEFLRMFSGLGLDGNPTSEDRWLNTIVTAEREGKLYQVQPGSFLTGNIVPVTSEEFLHNYIDTKHYQDNMSQATHR